MFDYSLMVLPGSVSAVVGASLDLLSCAADLAIAEGSAVPRWRICSPEPHVLLSNRIRIDAEPLPPRSEKDTSTWVLPGIGLGSPEALDSGLATPQARRIIEALKDRANTGGPVAASCSAVFILQAAGLLRQRHATTTWWLGARLRELEPSCDVDVDRIVVDDGDVVTGGAAFAHIDLMLHLIASRFGPGLADAVSRSMVFDSRRSQAPFILPAVLAGGNDLARQVVARFEAGLPDPPSITALADAFGLSTRTLSRRIKDATGKTAVALLQSVRLNRARVLLETSHMSIERVAAEVGYADPTALRRLMIKTTNRPPSRFRSDRNPGRKLPKP